MTGFDHYHHAQGLECLLDAFLDLKRHALLHLQTVAVDIDYAGNFREPRDVAVGDIGHMHLAVKGYHVVFAEREEIDVFDDNHLRVVFLEESLS